jgi:flagellar basal-body rod modification protein FlgD
MELINSVTAGAASKTEAPKSEAAVDREELKKDYDNFLKLFLKQLQTQDPLAPMDNTQFTNSLANLSQVEQSVKMNEKLTEIFDMLQGQSSVYGNPVSLLGKNVAYKAEKFSLEDGSARVRYASDGGADEMRVTVTDASGATVFNGVVDAAPGNHEFVWDGRDNNQRQLADGIYGVAVTAHIGEKAEDVTAYSSGVVGEIGFEDGKTMLRVGRVPVEAEAVVGVTEGTPEESG